MMLEAETVLALDGLLDVAGVRVEGEEVQIVVQGAPQVHVLVRAPETSLEAEQIDGHRVVRRGVIAAPEFPTVVGRNHVQLPAAGERNHVLVQDQGRGELRRQEDRRPLGTRTVRMAWSRKTTFWPVGGDVQRGAPVFRSRLLMDCPSW
jgi:hypothetical protein